MPEATLDLVLRALWLAARLSVPALAGALVGTLVAGLVQNFTAWQDGALSHVPRLAGVVVACALAAPWLGEEVLVFARLAWGGAP
jgi:flagellar biosynthetic protein FliQ